MAIPFAHHYNSDSLIMAKYLNVNFSRLIHQSFYKEFIYIRAHEVPEIIQMIF